MGGSQSSCCVQLVSTGSWSRCTGTPLHWLCLPRFAVNVGKDSNTLMLHFNPRFDCHGDVNTIVCNSKEDGVWGEEDRKADFPFQHGDKIEVRPQGCAQGTEGPRAQLFNAALCGAEGASVERGRSPRGRAKKCSELHCPSQCPAAGMCSVPHSGPGCAPQSSNSNEVRLRLGLSHPTAAEGRRLSC